jgi:hypothetical protein
MTGIRSAGIEPVTGRFEVSHRYKKADISHTKLQPELLASGISTSPPPLSVIYDFLSCLEFEVPALY